ncbi:MAG TPA: DUF1592 domain-containing protein [Hyphomicrobiales bacterium]|nr:DUF1592 domain-containing protein [Hyphomicrobiales bacterium]
MCGKRDNGLAPAVALLLMCQMAPAHAADAATSSGEQLFGSSENWELVETYCVKCHNIEDWYGQLALDFIDREHIENEVAVWEKVVRKLRGSMMPPPGSDRPANAQVDRMVAWLEGLLDQVEHPVAGYVPLHRLNRTEYANAVEELLALSVDPETLLPVDGVEDGFDNIASALKVSPTFIDQYVSAARALSDLAVGSLDVAPTSEVYNVSTSSQSGHVAGLPLGTRGGVMVEHYFPADGEYTLNIGNLVSTGSSLAQEHAQTLVALLDGQKIFETQIGGGEQRRELDQVQAPAVDRINQQLKNIAFRTTAGPHKLALTFRHRSFAVQEATLKALSPAGNALAGLEIRQFDVYGPTQVSGLSATPSRQRIFSCYPLANDEIGENACAREIVERLAQRAFRGQLMDTDLTSLMTMYEYGRKRSGGFEDGVKHALSAILVHPKFLYRFETPPNGLSGTPEYPLSSLELASRLSFFLWSALPDDALLAAAQDEGLRNPEVLRAQVRRMLDDPRAGSLATNFALQWLGIGALNNLTPDQRLFPDVQGDIKADMVEELSLFIDSVFKEDRNVTSLLDARYSFLNERLARHYGITDVHGSHFRRVEMADEFRWGLLGKGAVLMVSSYPNRTSPVLRGAWVLEHLMGTPAAAPPPNVEGLQENVLGQAATTVRARLEQHRANPSCNNCHGVLDPLGFALENFDATGRWRTIDREAGTPIDTTGVLPNGIPLQGPADLRKALLAKPGYFAQTLTENLMAYALGRKLEHTDMPTVRAIVARAAMADYRFSEIVLGIVESAQFQMNSNGPGGQQITANK